MKAALVTDDDLESAIRQKANVDSLDDVKEAFVEANGQISIILKEHISSYHKL